VVKHSSRFPREAVESLPPLEISNSTRYRSEHPAPVDHALSRVVGPKIHSSFQPQLFHDAMTLATQAKQTSTVERLK